MQKFESTRNKRGMTYSPSSNELVVREDLVLKFQTSVVATPLHKIKVLNCSMARLSEKESSPAGINISSNNNIFSVVEDGRQKTLWFI